ncbi:bifunctional 3'-5' exonuclease/ATP-dependent helicase WRN-like, partial [Hydractinia symbiolongicarpus]|uniref:bifunctional 3'-5' exonuclease/ATP-dependent helicase WRN-like n=1 Tax=Hydractinia symbiolongicarpus TaxID=13093 RepID=UPI00254AED44
SIGCCHLYVSGCASSSPLVLVVSPLISLIEDQVASANSLSALGLEASKLDIDCYKKICCGEYNILFGTPESWLDNLKWREFLLSKYVVDVCLVVDEVHKVTWGVAANRIDEPFHEAFGRISEMRSICRQKLPVLALSATVDVDLTQLIVSSCDLSKDLNIISTCSYRKNIRLTIIDIRDRENVESLRWCGTSIVEPVMALIWILNSLVSDCNFVI